MDEDGKWRRVESDGVEIREHECDEVKMFGSENKPNELIGSSLDCIRTLLLLLLGWV